MTSIRAREILDDLRSQADDAAREAQERQYGITSTNALGIPMRRLKAIAANLDTDHALALELWDSGIYEARTVAAFIDNPAEVSTAQMDRWCHESDSWAIVDTICFHLFDRAPDRWTRLRPWANTTDLYVKRAAFALLWALALHDRDADDSRYQAGLQLIQEHADDERPLVTKAQTMALRAIIQKRPSIAPQALALATELSESPVASHRRVGRPIIRAFA